MYFSSKLNVEMFNVVSGFSTAWFSSNRRIVESSSRLLRHKGNTRLRREVLDYLIIVGYVDGDACKSIIKVGFSQFLYYLLLCLLLVCVSMSMSTTCIFLKCLCMSFWSIELSLTYPSCSSLINCQ
jgi:hypothetical protein